MPMKLSGGTTKILFPKNGQIDMSQSVGAFLYREWILRDDLVTQIKPRTSGQNQIDFGQLLRLLKYSGIPYHVVAKGDWDDYIKRNPIEKVFLAPRVDLEGAAYNTIWQDRVVKVEFATENGRKHLLVSPQTSIPLEEKAILDHPKECVAVQRAALTAASAFARVFSSADYAQKIVARQGTFSIELFPAGSKQAQVTLPDKDRRNIFWMTDGQFGSYQFPPVKENVSLEAEIVKSCDHKEEAIPQLFTDFSVAEWGMAAAARADMMLSMFSHEGLPVAPILRAKPYLPRELPVQENKLGANCPFCKEAVIKNESLDIRAKEHVVLFNAKAYLGQDLWDQDTSSWQANPEARHHLVIVNQHGIKRTDSEIIERMAIVARLQDSFAKVHSDLQPTNFQQLGQASGQTLAHQHTHVMTSSIMDAAEYLYLLLGEPPIVGDKSEASTGTPRPSEALVVAYNHKAPVIA